MTLKKAVRGGNYCMKRIYSLNVLFSAPFDILMIFYIKKILYDTTIMPHTLEI
jgi:hypothetical protein